MKERILVDLDALRATIQAIVRDACPRAHTSTAENALINAALELDRARTLFVVQGQKSAHARYKRAAAAHARACARVRAERAPVKQSRSAKRVSQHAKHASRSFSFALRRVILRAALTQCSALVVTR